MWRKDAHRPGDFDDPAAERVWFANQLSDDACASLAILNVVLNCPDIEMKGLAISGSPFIWRAHRELARPSDLRGALNKAESTRTATASKHTSAASTVAKPKKEEADDEEVYHFIGYSGPLEVGELSDDPEKKTWMDVVRPALRMKMQKYGGAEGGNNIRFSLLAIVDGLYEEASDHFEFLKRERLSIERRMNPGWESLVVSHGVSRLGRTYAPDFGSRRMTRDLEIFEMPERALANAWEQCEFVARLQNEGLLDPLLDVNNDAANEGKRVKLNGKSGYHTTMVFMSGPTRKLSRPRNGCPLNLNRKQLATSLGRREAAVTKQTKALRILTTRGRGRKAEDWSTRGLSRTRGKDIGENSRGRQIKQEDAAGE
ncbi:hypothetical protein B0H10DRAFT_2148262 [Mycena sp. CBHHK59/15]|nr:hypothetical protein B0H10DRAFT_2148262 [Mycena sp. CBHHK59/15]